jgi:hypothetical protein
MKKISKFFWKSTLHKSVLPIMIIVLALITGLPVTGCDKGPKNLSAPANINVKVTGRTMTVTWNAVANAQGYEIVTTSVGCGSGNRTINTKENTTVATRSGNPASNVNIGAENSITITLMAARGNPDAAMASAVTAMVKSLGGTVSGKEYIDSDYSETVNHAIQK